MNDEVKAMDYSKEIERLRDEIFQSLTECVETWWKDFRKKQDEYERTLEQTK